MLLAELEQVMMEQDRWVIATDDVRKAFDTVQIADVMAEHRRHITDDKLLRLVEAVLRGKKTTTTGIEQGSAYSPTSLNVLLHRYHDLGFTQGDPPWYRYADNLVYLCQSVAEGNEVLGKTDQLLAQVQLTLKGKDGPPRNLRQGEEAQLVGFTLFQKNGRLGLGLGDNAWTKLNQNLKKAQQSVNPPLTAVQVVKGWINGYGPAFESLRTEATERILQMANRLGFREIGSPETVEGWSRDAWENWNAFCERVHSGHAIAI
jgi:hypothetical protein